MEIINLVRNNREYNNIKIEIFKLLEINETFYKKLEQFENKLIIIKQLKEFGYDFTKNNNYALKWATFNGYFDIVVYLIENCSCDPYSDFKKPFYNACLNGYLEIVKYLFNYYKSKNKLELELYHSLCEAVKNNHINIIEFLINNYKFSFNQLNDALWIAKILLNNTKQSDKIKSYNFIINYFIQVICLYMNFIL